ncbi:GtrA family protein [Herbaspirillum lusitanum]|nr:GtrA family protein [Herbaspirillum lusitanum]
MRRNRWLLLFFQVVRYGIVGVLNNLLGYLIYLALTWLWLDPKLAITLLYPIGAMTAYFGHAKYAFAYQGAHSYGVLRYVMAHLIGYAIDVSLLHVFTDRLGFPHQAVQACAVIVVGGVLYLLFRYWVFPSPQINK